MRNFLAMALSAFCFTFTVHAEEGPCVIQTKSQSQLLHEMSRYTESTYRLGSVEGVLAGGELDPELGEGGILAVGQENGSLVVYQKGEDSPIITQIYQNASQGKKLIGINEKCLLEMTVTDDEDSDLISKLSRFVKEEMGVRGPLSFYGLVELPPTPAPESERHRSN